MLIQIPRPRFWHRLLHPLGHTWWTILHGSGSLCQCCRCCDAKRIIAVRGADIPILRGWEDVKINVVSSALLRFELLFNTRLVGRHQLRLPPPDRYEDPE